MKIKVSYRHNKDLYFLRFMESTSLETARMDFKFSHNDSIPTKLPSKVNLIFEYQELIDAKKLISKKLNNMNKRMLLFMKLCPNFKVVKQPYQTCGFFKEKYDAIYDGEIITINLQASKDYYDGSFCFDIKLR